MGYYIGEQGYYEGDRIGNDMKVSKRPSHLHEPDGNGGWVYSETPEQAAKRLELALDGHIDSVAKSYRYTSIHTMVTYATSEHPTFGAEGKAAVLFRDACYAKAIQIQEDVQASKRDIPTEKELIAEMPLFTDFL